MCPDLTRAQRGRRGTTTDSMCVTPVRTRACMSVRVHARAFVCAHALSSTTVLTSGRHIPNL